MSYSTGGSNDTDMTWQLWVYNDAWNSSFTDNLWGKGNNVGVSMVVHGDGGATPGDVEWKGQGSNRFSCIGNTNSLSTWTLIHGVWDDAGSDAYLYQQGVETADSLDAAEPLNDSAGTTWISGDVRDGTPYQLDGRIDEVRMLRAVLSANWCRTEWSNYNWPGDFIKVGAQQ